MNKNIIGYVVVDKETKKLDWDGELHPLRVDAIESLTGPRQMWCKCLEDETEERTYWGKAYIICPVLAPEPGSAPAKCDPSAGVHSTPHVGCILR